MDLDHVAGEAQQPQRHAEAWSCDFHNRWSPIQNGKLNHGNVGDNEDQPSNHQTWDNEDQPSNLAAPVLRQTLFSSQFLPGQVAPPLRRWTVEALAINMRL